MASKLCQMCALLESTGVCGALPPAFRRCSRATWVMGLLGGPSQSSSGTAPHDDVERPQARESKHKKRQRREIAEANGTFEIRLERREGLRLGVDMIHSSDKAALLVHAVDKEGLISEWNRANPDKQVAVGDRIINVCGVEGDAENLLDEIKNGDVVVLTIMLQKDRGLQPPAYRPGPLRASVPPVGAGVQPGPAKDPVADVNAAASAGGAGGPSQQMTMEAEEQNGTPAVTQNDNGTGTPATAISHERLVLLVVNLLKKRGSLSQEVEQRVKKGQGITVKKSSIHVLNGMHVKVDVLRDALARFTSAVAKATPTASEAPKEERPPVAPPRKTPKASASTASASTAPRPKNTISGGASRRPGNQTSSAANPCASTAAKAAGGKSICEHGAQRFVCMQCWKADTGGAGICEHGTVRTRCKPCIRKGDGLLSQPLRAGRRS